MDRLAGAVNPDVNMHVARLETQLVERAQGGRALLEAPGCWDAFSARMGEAAGAAAVFLSPQTMAMARYGRPDGSSIAFGELANTNASIRESVSLPLIIDACGGFGNSLNVLRVVRLFERAGASAIALSDEVITGSVQEARRERVVAAADMIGKLKAALDARSDCLIIARTLAARTEGSAAAFDRAEAYLEAGADLLIINAAPEHFRVEAIAKRFAGRAAVIHDYGFGHSSDVGALELEALGYSAVLKPTLLLDAMSAATPRLGSGPKPIRPRLSESRQAAILGLDTLQSASEPRARRR